MRQNLYILNKLLPSVNWTIIEYKVLATIIYEAEKLKRDLLSDSLNFSQNFF
jgi:hypothetical protein